MSELYYTFGSPVFDDKFHFVISTFPRELRTRPGVGDAAAHTEKTFGLPPGSAGVWCGLDKAVDFPNKETPGVFAYNLALQTKILPGFLKHSKAEILVVLESSCRWCDNVTPEFLPKLYALSTLEPAATVWGFHGNCWENGRHYKNRRQWHKKWYDKTDGTGAWIHHSPAISSTCAWWSR